jgi:hypothetical protein
VAHCRQVPGSKARVQKLLAIDRHFFPRLLTRTLSASIMQPHSSHKVPNRQRRGELRTRTLFLKGLFDFGNLLWPTSAV